MTARILAFAVCVALGGVIGVGFAGLDMLVDLTLETVLLAAGALAGMAVLLGFILVIGMAGHSRELARDADEDTGARHA